MHTLYVHERDAAGNWSASGSFTFVIDTTPPGAPACDSGWELRFAYFTYTNTVSGGATSLYSMDSTANCAVTSNYVRIFTDAPVASAGINADSIEAAANSIFDGADNAMSTASYLLRATVAPYLITACSYVSAGKYYLRVVFSKPVHYDSAMNIANYTLSEDISTSCADIASIPLSVKQVSSTIFDLETGHTTPTVYKIVVSNRILDENEIEGLGAPDTVTKIGTSVTDLTPPKRIQALALSPTTVQITDSGPMKSGDVIGSASCEATYTTSATCIAAVDGIGGTQLKYTFAPTIGTVNSVIATANPSVFFITHNNVQSGVFYNIAAYALNNVTNIPQDLSGNKLQSAPLNKATFKGMGSAITRFEDGPLFTDPFADGSKFSYAFRYKDKIYPGSNDTNNIAFRFEPDASNPTTVIFLASGTSCTSSTFGIPGGSTCGGEFRTKRRKRYSWFYFRYSENFIHRL